VVRLDGEKVKMVSVERFEGEKRERRWREVGEV